MSTRSIFHRCIVFAALGSGLLALAGCQVPQTGTPDFAALSGGTFENVGAVIKDPNGAFRIVGGEPFTTPFSNDCTQLNAAADGWKDALTAGAHKVLISLPGQPRTYGGVLALCTIHKSATGPASRSYDLVIPDNKIPSAQDGLIASIAEQVDVNRQSINVGALLTQALTGQTSNPTSAQQAYASSAQAITEDYAWMLWFSDDPGVFGISSGEAPPAVARPSPGYSPIPAPTKGQTYTAAVVANLRSGAGASQPIIGMLSPGDAVVATGEEKGGFWAVTTVAGQAGWVWARSLKLN